MTLTTDELNNNAMFVFMKYHLDSSGTITDYLTFQTNYSYTIIDGADLTIDSWDLSSSEPSVETLKSTYSLSDISGVKHILDDIMWMRLNSVTTTTDRVELTPYAQEGNLIYDKNDSKLYVMTEGSWVALT